MSILKRLGKEFLFFEGGMGTTLQKKGLTPSELPESWNISHPDVITGIHLDYLNAGCDIIKLNTFGANRFKFPQKQELEKVITAAFNNAKKAVELSGRTDVYIALDIGPCGKLLKPYGDLDFEDAAGLFGEVASVGASIGVDLVLVETMNDIYETKAAVLGVKEKCSLPLFVTNAYDMSGKLMTGASPEAVCAVLEGLGADAIGLNCSFGPEESKAVVERLAKCSSLPLIVCPNAGLPQISEGKTVYNVDEDKFASLMEEIADLGVHVAGGCCGTTPAYMKKMIQKLKGRVPLPVTEKNLSVIASYTHTVEFGKTPVIIGERINPTGKKAFKEALRNNDIDYILNVGIKQDEAGAHVLDVNVGLPEIDEVSVMKNVVTTLQTVTNLPLQIDTTNPEAMEKALRLYNGKAMINSVNGTKESMEAVFPLVKKYGGVVVALTLDENGIPKTAQERVEIAEKIYAKALSYGISKKDIIVDTLAMTVSADKDAPTATLDALETISKGGGNTVLGVSNISFGLPQREFVNSAFFTMALSKGLSAAIINPHSVEMIKAYRCYMALSGKDENCMDYIDFASSVSVVETTSEKRASSGGGEVSSLKDAIVKGLTKAAESSACKLLEECDPLDVINNQIVPALDIVGKGFEEKKVYLPQLLISAEAAKAAFDAVGKKILASGGNKESKCPFVIATVKGDIHDIGKNIVKVLLENYGFNVIDLGKDVEPTDIVKAVKECSAPIVGLSALMTTTVPAMEETVQMLKKECPGVKTVVGGAVLTEEYASMIGADKYAADAMETVRYAEALNNEILKKGR